MDRLRPLARIPYIGTYVDRLLARNRLVRWIKRCSFACLVGFAFLVWGYANHDILAKGLQDNNVYRVRGSRV